jgi:two-component system, OmpR family, sensor kinase
MNDASCFVLMCDSFGIITQVLQNSFGAEVPLQTDMPLARLEARGFFAKALSFLDEINSSGTAPDWEFNLQVGEKLQNVHFTGGKTGEQILVVGAVNLTTSRQLYVEMLSFIAKLNDNLPAVLDGHLESDHSEPGHNEFNEISHLNNELVAMQRELAKKNAELIRLNDLKNQFLGMAAHDLRNPLQGILSCSEFLIEEAAGKLDPGQANFLSLIRDQSRYMANLVDDMLDVSAIESGMLQLDLQPVDLVRLVQTNLVRNRLIATRKGITIDLQADPVPTISLDSAKIEQVLDNLLTNAIKFSPPGAHVQMVISILGKDVLISVQDQGTGISHEQMSRLFQPFQRGKKGTQGEKSTGLGLIIVKRIVEGHGGRIEARSQPGKGSTFTLYLPISL